MEPKELLDASAFVMEAVQGISGQEDFSRENPRLRDLLKDHTAMFNGRTLGGPAVDRYRRRFAEEAVLRSLRMQEAKASKSDVGVGEVPALLAEIIPETIWTALLPRIANVHMVTSVKGKIRKKGAQLSTTKGSTTAGADSRDLQTVDYTYAQHVELASDIGEIKQNATFIDYEVASKMLRYAYSIESGIAGTKELGEDTLADGLREAIDRLQLEADAEATALILASSHAGNVNHSELPAGSLATDPEKQRAQDLRLLRAMEEAALLCVAEKGFRPNVVLAGSTVVKILGNLADREFKLIDDRVLGMVQGDQTLAVPMGTLATRLGVWIIIYVPWLNTNKAILSVVTTKRGKRQSGIDFFVFQAPYTTDAVLNTGDGSYSALALEMVDIVVGEPKMYSTVTIVSS